LKAFWEALRNPRRIRGGFYTGPQMWGLPWLDDAIDPRTPKDEQARATAELERARERMPPPRA
jgi:hypothetical protein